MNNLRIAFLKIAALYSFCGGPLLVSDRLKPHFGSQVAFLVTFVPVGLMLIGALFLEGDIGDRVDRAAVWWGRQALYVVVAMHAYAVWCFVHGLRVSEPYLYYTGIAVGLIWAIVYLRAARRWAAPQKRGSVDYGHQEGPPIEPSHEADERRAMLGVVRTDGGAAVRASSSNRRSQPIQVSGPPMNPEIVFPASRVKAALLFLGSIAFVALGIWVADRHPIVGWVGAAFFALGVPASIFMLLPNSMYLRLTPQGFEMHSPLRTTFIRWSQVERFELCSIQGAPLIAIVHNPLYSEQKTLRAVASLLAGVESAVPNNYRASRAEVFAALTEWHCRYRQQGA